jgi:hypothetical protein
MVGMARSVREVRGVAVWRKAPQRLMVLLTPLQTGNHTYLNVLLFLLNRCCSKHFINNETHLDKRE